MAEPTEQATSALNTLEALLMSTDEEIRLRAAEAILSWDAMKWS